MISMDYRNEELELKSKHRVLKMQENWLKHE
jgi:hypothetical protein